MSEAGSKIEVGVFLIFSYRSITRRFVQSGREGTLLSIAKTFLTAGTFDKGA
jgi:hypothetical protein